MSREMPYTVWLVDRKREREKCFFLSRDTSHRNYEDVKVLAMGARLATLTTNSKLVVRMRQDRDVNSDRMNKWQKMSPDEVGWVD